MSRIRPLASSRLAFLALFLLPLTACREEMPTTPAAPQALAATDRPDLTDRYIVVFKPSVADVDALVEALTRAYGGTPGYRYHTVLKGYAATLPAAALDGIRRNPNVEYLEPDGIATVVGSGSQSLASYQWGLDRVDQRALSRDYLYTWQTDGTGVEAYIVDTGILFSHQEFGGRAHSFYDYVDNDTDASDCDGHGTHVAGTVGGNTVGIARNVTLYAARVLDCNGSGWSSDIIAAIDDITARKVTNPAIPIVGNMSLGGGFSAPFNTAVNNSVAAGVVWAIAAGNSGADACNYSPAAAAGALTVGATTSTDARANFSNWGTCVDLFAPGAAIYSSTMTGTNTYESWNGTSMATPHVAGVAALYLSAWPDASASEVNQALTSRATPGVVTGAGTGSPNLLLYSLLTTPRLGAPPPASYLLSVTLAGSGTGAVTSNPAGIDCGSTCSATFASGTQVTLNQAAGTGSTFAGWSGACTGTGACTVTMDQAKSVTATFNLTQVIHLGGLTGSKTSNKNNWSATATATVHDGVHAPVSGAVVTFTLSGGKGSGSCTTGTSGQCSWTKSGLKNNVSSVIFTVTGISKSGTTYDAVANHPVTSVEVVR